MTYSKLVNLIKESHDSWFVSEALEHLPESQQEKDFLLEGIESIDGLDAETLMGMLQDDLAELTKDNGSWCVYNMEDGTMDIQYLCQTTLMGLYFDVEARSLCDPNHQAWIAAGKPEDWDYCAIELSQDFFDQCSTAYDKMMSEYLLKREQMPL